MAKILLIGSSGQLGQEVQKLLEFKGEDYISCDRGSLNLSNISLIESYIYNVQPDIVINCSAYTAVDRAEEEVEQAFLINHLVVEAIAKATKQIGSYLIHISTDYVFDGQNYLPYSEEDLTNPRSTYGKSKLAGEQAIIKQTDKYIIVRTAWVYGIYGKGNFVKTMLKLGQARENLGIVSDQIGSPTWTKDLAMALLQICKQLSQENSGIYHFTNSGVCSWYDFASAIFMESKSLGYPLKLTQLKPITTSEYPTPAQRPHYSVLSTKKISNLLGEYPPHWHQSLRLMLEKYLK
ncbi:dTDP-4-dehydrorhamnose reductase [[Leptolyngbya] sp. PCC 7376]|uniref:dTDP-4-dehydrorhamnose reductase n=1 Tax=[Leptolyngbya] sp. PCC 7376 TaxID=111781 RepID=UPI00029EF2BA|nr:dTDP-4-dehydrorhamnose reductase [[Leptolyngbya] sp. PCC 7376]AFY36954.1 dTDP-4-dehydrorhamnose reductase [[Leptolyngbya] sp. PCC 7376]